MIGLSDVVRLEEDIQAGVDTGLRALATSGTIGSALVRDRFHPLASHAP
ncbi:hypothetical protein C8D88_107123 [Lentzea atacamensis]|uniref:Uncharacterized protein n=1 Tax=Lentzea atacamensis TaxID=531938 RepID=A0A316HW45_9PSEU|nr:hypothetical protein [Lentzea atacamensis]PWK84916.1 hypothetical protein C8D88_107123 [Lentzea atacamensis]RAS65928.1 hypothetical protein C8D87_104479 [Lentzea atacamensis]